MWKRKLLALPVVGMSVAASVAGLAGPANASRVDGQAIDLNGTINIAFYNQLSNFDPALALGGPDYNILSQTYDTLVHLSPNGSAEPGMATSWSFSPNGLVMTMNLRAGIKFQDGTPFTASTVEANIMRGKTLPSSTLTGFLAPVKAVDVVNPLEVKFTLSSPDQGLPLDLAFDAGMMVSPGALANKNLDILPDGSGMFTVTNYDPGVSVSFARNPNYWDESVVKVEHMNMTFVSTSQTRLDGLESSQYNAAQLDPPQAPAAAGAGLHTLVAPTLRVFSIQVNPKLAPEFNSEAVRIAFEYGLDRTGLVQALGAKYNVTMDQLYSNSSFASDPAIDNYYPYDPAKAKALLAAAGYPHGFSLNVVTDNSTSEIQALEIIQQGLAKAGVIMKIQIASGDGSGSEFWSTKTVPAIGTGVFATFDPVSTYVKFFSADGFNNAGDVTSPVVTKLINEAMAQSNTAVRNALLKQLDVQLVKQPLSLFPIYQVEETTTWTKNVTGLQNWISGFPNMTNVAVTS